MLKILLFRETLLQQCKQQHACYLPSIVLHKGLDPAMLISMKSVIMNIHSNFSYFDRMLKIPRVSQRWTPRWRPILNKHDDVIKWKHFPRYWPFVRGIHRSVVNSQHKGQWRGTLMFSSICAWINAWINNREAGDLRHHRTHYDVTVMRQENSCVANCSTCSRDNTPNTWSQHDCRYQQYEVDRLQNFTVNITRWCGNNTTTYINLGLRHNKYGYLTP